MVLNPFVLPPILSRLNAALLIMESGGNSTTLLELDSLCKSLGIPVTVIGGMAVASHGYPRFTADIDLLIRRGDAPRLAMQLLARGWSDLGENKLSDGTVTINLCGEGVKAGRMVFPAPLSDVPGVHVADLPLLLVLKLRANRHKDRSDYVELVKRNQLDWNYITAEVLPRLTDPMDRQLAQVLWQTAQDELRADG